MENASKLHKKYKKHLSLKRYSQSLSQRGWVIFPWAKPACQNTGFLPFCCVMWLMWDKKTVRFTSILDTFWHCAISWVGRSGGKILLKHVHFLLTFENWNWLSGRKRRDVRYVQRACLTNHCKYVYCLSRAEKPVKIAVSLFKGSRML